MTKKNHGNLKKKIVKEMKNKTKLRFNQSNVKEEKNDLHQLEQACQIYKSSYETDISQ
jgi:hypothetical protein